MMSVVGLDIVLLYSSHSFSIYLLLFPVRLSFSLSFLLCFSFFILHREARKRGRFGPRQ